MLFTMNAYRVNVSMKKRGVLELKTTAPALTGQEGRQYPAQHTQF